MSSSFPDRTPGAATQTSRTAKDEAAVTAQTAKDELGATTQTAKDEAAATAQTAKEQAGQVGSTAASAATDVVATTKEQASNVAGEALDQVRDLTDQLRAQLSEQAAHAASMLSKAVRSLAEELHDMGSNTGERSGAASQAAQSLAARGHSLADYLDGSDPDTMLSDLRASAARRPGRFLLGAVVAGVLTGRLGRSAKAARDAGLTTTGSTPVTPPPALPTPPAERATTTAVYPTYDASAQPVGFGSLRESHPDSDSTAAPLTSSADSELR